MDLGWPQTFGPKQIGKTKGSACLEDECENSGDLIGTCSV